MPSNKETKATKIIDERNNTFLISKELKKSQLVNV